MPAPSLVVCDNGPVSFSAITTAGSQNDISWNAGDLLVAVGFSGEPDTLTFSGGLLTWTQQVIASTTSTASIWTALPTSASTDTLFLDRTLTDTVGFGGTWYVFSGSGGPGATASTSNVGTPSVSITTTGPNSVIVACIADTNNSNVAATWLTSASTFTSYLDDISGTNLEVHNGYYTNVTTAGTYTIGNSAPVSQIYDFVALEIKAASNSVATAWIHV